MLCKRIMRAALAPVIGLVGLLGATMVSAQDNDIDVVVAVFDDSHGMEVAGPVTLASETLSGATGMVTEGHYHVFTASSSDQTVVGDPQDKPDRWLELRADVDILLTNRGDSDHYYIRYDLDGMVFSAQPPKPEIRVPVDFEFNSEATSSTYMVSGDDIAVAYRGRRGDSTVIYRLPSNPSGDERNEIDLELADGGTARDVNVGRDYPVDTRFTLLLPHHLAVMAARTATYSVRFRVFEDLSEARETLFGADVFHADGDVIKLAPAVAPATVVAKLAIAEVSTPEEMGGAFRLFVDGEDEGTDPDTSANLATVNVGLVDNPPLHANNNLMTATAGDIGLGADVVATSDAGNFVVGSFHVGTAGCESLALALMKDGAGGPEAIGMDEEALATSGTVTINPGESSFCNNVKGNEDPIMEVGDPEMLDGYMLTVTPTIDVRKMPPAAVMPAAGEPMAAGAIDRNGTTVHITYLSASDRANQRLVIVNRGADPARFWMTEFQAEGGAMVTHIGAAELAQGTESEVPGGARRIVRVQQNLAVSAGPQRTAGTLTVAAPTRHIDVMTVQVVGGTLDSTVYQHAE